MPGGLFVAGTGTGVGKTVVSAALALRFPHLSYWKPVQTGIEQDDDAAEVRRLAGCHTAEGIRLPRPLSPHLAARLAGVVIRIAELQIPAGGPWIVEGAGGVLVPLNETELMIDLMCALALPVLVVGLSSLGTINHTLLTLEALRTRELCVAGVVLTGAKNAENRAAIEHYGGVPVIGELPPVEPLDRPRLGAWADAEFDTNGRLQELLL